MEVEEEISLEKLAQQLEELKSNLTLNLELGEDLEKLLQEFQALKKTSGQHDVKIAISESQLTVGVKFFNDFVFDDIRDAKTAEDKERCKRRVIRKLIQAFNEADLRRRYKIVRQTRIEDGRWTEEERRALRVRKDIFVDQLKRIRSEFIQSVSINKQDWIKVTFKFGLIAGGFLDLVRSDHFTRDIGAEFVLKPWLPSRGLFKQKTADIAAKGGIKGGKGGKGASGLIPIPKNNVIQRTPARQTNQDQQQVENLSQQNDQNAANQNEQNTAKEEFGKQLKDFLKDLKVQELEKYLKYNFPQLNDGDQLQKTVKWGKKNIAEEILDRFEQYSAQDREDLLQKPNAVFSQEDIQTLVQESPKRKKGGTTAPKRFQEELFKHLQTLSTQATEALARRAFPAADFSGADFSNFSARQITDYFCKRYGDLSDGQKKILLNQHSVSVSVSSGSASQNQILLNQNSVGGSVSQCQKENPVNQTSVEGVITSVIASGSAGKGEENTPRDNKGPYGAQGGKAGKKPGNSAGKDSKEAEHIAKLPEADSKAASIKATQEPKDARDNQKKKNSNSKNGILPPPKPLLAKKTSSSGQIDTKGFDFSGSQEDFLPETHDQSADTQENPFRESLQSNPQKGSASASSSSSGGASSSKFLPEKPKGGLVQAKLRNHLNKLGWNSPLRDQLYDAYSDLEKQGKKVTHRGGATGPAADGRSEDYYSSHEVDRLRSFKLKKE